MWGGSGIRRRTQVIHGFTHGPFHLKLPTVNPAIFLYRWNRLRSYHKVRSKNLRVKKVPSGPSVSPPLLQLCFRDKDLKLVQLYLRNGLGLLWSLLILPPPLTLLLPPPNPTGLVVVYLVEVGFYLAGSSRVRWW